MAKAVDNNGQRFYTLVKKDHIKYGGNKFVLGKIEGFKELLCDYDFANEGGRLGMYPMHRDSNNNRVLETVCTPEMYEKFTRLVELHYPGLCVFNCEYDRKMVK